MAGGLPFVAPPPADCGAFFDNLSFRDTRQTALNKLKASKIVEMTADETFLGRSGLNGFFRTRKKIGTLNGYLYFDWTETGRLRELNLQTEPRLADSYKTELEPAWKQIIKLLEALYGAPAVKEPLPSMASLTDGSFVPSHFWKLATGGSALIGTVREGQKYEGVVRFTQKVSQVIGIPKQTLLEQNPHLLPTAVTAYRHLPKMEKIAISDKTASPVRFTRVARQQAVRLRCLAG